MAKLQIEEHDDGRSMSTEELQRPIGFAEAAEAVAASGEAPPE